MHRVTTTWYLAMTKLRSYLCISDVHLGSRSTTANEILDHLTEFFGDFRADSPLASIDVLFIAGDLWDDTLQFSSDVLGLFIPWFHRLMNWAGRNNIKIRIMEGTPRHDRLQGMTVQKIAEPFLDRVDFKYVPLLSIEHIQDLDLNVLYVPDECRPTADAVARDVEALFGEHSLDKVDIAIMHGMFKYQMGKIPMNAKVHDENWYLERVKHYINIGHVHTASQCGRILAQGSFDRLNHGEEEPKGAILIKELSPGEWGHFFIQNPKAKTYKTVQVKGDIDKALKAIDASISKLPHGSYVRIQALATHPIFQGFETLRRRYPLFTFSKKAVAEDEEVVQRDKENLADYIPIVLNRETLTEAIFGEVTVQGELDPNEESKLYQLLEKLHES